MQATRPSCPNELRVEKENLADAQSRPRDESASPSSQRASHAWEISGMDELRYGQPDQSYFDDCGVAIGSTIIPFHRKRQWTRACEDTRRCDGRTWATHDKAWLRCMQTTRPSPCRPDLPLDDQSNQWIGGQRGPLRVGKIQLDRKRVGSELKLVGGLSVDGRWVWKRLSMPAPGVVCQVLLFEKPSVRNARVRFH